MSKRIGDTYLDWHIKNATEPYSRFDLICLDLRDARARIRELEALSASQAQALDLMEAGKL